MLDYLFLPGNFVFRNFQNKSVVLCYHCFKKCGKHVSLPEYVDLNNCIGKELFELQIAWLSGFCDFVSLEELLELKQCSRKKKWRVAVTFDDGYKSVAEIGIPIFKKYDIPVTWFIASKFVEEPHVLPWWDLLAFIVEFYRGKLKFKILEDSYTFDFEDLDQRLLFQNKFDRLLKNATLEQREIIQSTLEKIISKKLKLPNNGMIRIDELSEISSIPLMTIGGHTHSHINMAKCSEQELQLELHKNSSKLTEWTGQEVKYFSYPFGKKRYVNAFAAEAVRMMGFRGAVMTEMGFVKKSVDSYRIPRLPIDPNWTILRFKTRFCNIGIVKKLM